MGNRSGIMMKLAIALAFIAASSAAPVTDRQINDQEAVDEINALPDLLWTAGKNSWFNGQSLSSFKDLAGVKSDSLEQVLALPKAESTLTASDVPAEFDSETNWPQCAKVIGDIRDQSNCGCCWAFAGASAASDRLCISTNGTVAVPLSAEDVCFCASSNGCGGGQITTPWSYISEGGAVTGGNSNSTGALGGGFCKAFSLPHCHHHGPHAHAHVMLTPRLLTTNSPLTSGLSARAAAGSSLGVVVVACSTHLARLVSSRPSWRADL